MKIISFGLQKGGVGKTSISFSLACELAKNYKVLIVDGDPQGNSSAWILKSLKNEFADVLLNGKPVKQCITKTDVKNLDILATFGDGGLLKKYRDSADSSDKPFQIKKILKEVSDIYDFCIIDSSPSNSPLERNLFFASNEIVPVLQFNQFSVDGFEIFSNQLKEWCDNFDMEQLKIKCIVLNNFDKRYSFHKECLDIFKSSKSGFDFIVFPTDSSFNFAQKNNCSVQSLKSTKKETLEALEQLASKLSNK